MSDPVRTPYHLFETALGACAVVWGPDGIVGVYLPESDAQATARRVRRRFADAEPRTPPTEVQHAVDGIVALLAGEHVELGGVRLDMRGVEDFHRRVYELARRIPPGATRSYGELAAELGDVALSRDVGQALGANRFPLVVPCHRVLAADGSLGGFSAPGGVLTKRKLLDIERAPAVAQLSLL